MVLRIAQISHLRSQFLNRSKKIQKSLEWLKVSHELLEVIVEHKFKLPIQYHEEISTEYICVLLNFFKASEIIDDLDGKYLQKLDENVVLKTNGLIVLQESVLDFDISQKLLLEYLKYCRKTYWFDNEVLDRILTYKNSILVNIHFCRNLKEKKVTKKVFPCLVEEYNVYKIWFLIWVIVWNIFV